MAVSALTGGRVRARRLALGLAQGDVAQAAGISASYLNLIEHNRRRVPQAVLERLSQVLGQPAAALAEGAEGAVLDDLRAAALGWPAAELARVEEFAQRFPGFAQMVLGQQQRLAQMDAAIAAVNDRMSHDPHLSATLHEVLSVAASVRATSEILVQTEDLEPEWQARFLRNLDQDSARLAAGAGALLRYLDSGGQIDAQGMAAPQEEVEAWAAGLAWALAGAGVLGKGGLVDGGLGESGGGEGGGSESGGGESGANGAAQALSPAARALAESWAARAARDLAALPEAGFATALALHGPDALAIAASLGADPMAAHRRLGMGAGLGLVICDASGTLVLRKAAAGFSLPRFGAACPLWPLFTALARPMQPVEVWVQMAGPSGARFLLRAYCAAQYPQGFAGPELREAVMLILPETAALAAQVPARPPAPLVVGPSCRVCAAGACPARREPSILP